jgi:hypothetical protein
VTSLQLSASSTDAAIGQKDEIRIVHSVGLALYRKSEPAIALLPDCLESQSRAKVAGKSTSTGGQS